MTSERKVDVVAVLELAATNVHFWKGKDKGDEVRHAIDAVKELIAAVGELHDPKFAQVITFEGCDYILVSPDSYGSILDAASSLGGKL